MGREIFQQLTMLHSRIAIFVPSLRGGGAERVMVTLANAFSARGFDVDLILASAQGPYLRDVVPDVRVVDLRAERVIKALLPLIAYLRRERPVAMLSAMGHANVVGIAAKILSGVPVRIVISERSTISIERQRSSGIFARVVYLLIPWLYRKADGVCTVSLQASRNLANFAGLNCEKITTIYNPFDLTAIGEAISQEIEHSWFSMDAPPVILAVGRLTEQKGFSELISAFAKLRRSRRIRLLILGEGSLREALISLAMESGLTVDDFQMPGFVGNPFAYMARCSLFVLSSRWEGLPGVLIQALACGAPVISTDCPSGPSEILEEGRWGRLVPVGDVDALAKAMAEVLDTPREQLPDGRVRALDFEQERAVDAYLRLLGVQSA